MLGAALPGLIGCRRCSRLAGYLDSLPPRRNCSRQDYWNRPVPGFGDDQARVCLVGLAPGAHGANRTGRPFTGDGAGDFMYPLLHRAGFASQGQAIDIADGLQLRDLYISNAVKCVPPENRPLPGEFDNCRPFLEEELASLPHLQVVLLLGQGAFTSYLRLLRDQGVIKRLGDYPFSHGAVHRPSAGPILVASYHTSRYNVQTGRINQEMFLELLQMVKNLLAGENC
jgi:uracil-DNA glycosylase family 4